MTNGAPETLHDINWHELRSRELARQNWKVKGPDAWDKRAPSFAERHKRTMYSELFLKEMPLEPDMTVLDIGSGPGTLSLPIASQVHKVTAIDFSPAMLAALREQATQQQLTNITTINCGWEDDWDRYHLQPHDIAIASRALAVTDLQAALDKLNTYAIRYVFISDRIGVSPFEVGAYTALGRPFQHGPDYIYTVNMLYRMNIHPNIKILEFARETEFASFSDAISAFAWMFHELTADEHELLTQYVKDHIVSRDGDKITVRRENPPRWALIWWAKQ